MATVDFTDVSKRFGEAVVLRDLSLTVADRQMLVLVGPSGCGKTTLLRILAGLETPSSGRVEIDGVDVTALPATERDVAMVFQNYALYPHMSASDNIGFGLRMRGVGSAGRGDRIAAVSRMLGIETLLARLPAALSGGQRQRVAMGRAIARRPRVFLMDEPLSNLDAELRARVRGEVRRLQRELAVTTVYVTHDQVEAMTMADRIAVFRSGELQQVGTPDEVYSRPANLFVAGFMGTPPMGFLRCTVEGAALVAPSLLGATLGAARRGAVAGQRQVVLGLRSEHVAPNPGDGAVTWRGTVYLVERLGGETLVHMAGDTGGVVLRLPATRRVREGDALTLSVDLARAHLFAPEGPLLSAGTQEPASCH